MRISEFLSPEAVIAELSSSSKHGALVELCAPLTSVQAGLPAERLVDVLEQREKLGSTGIGEGVAIPHGKMAQLPRLIASFGVSHQGVNFDAIDGKPTHLFFALLAPENSAGIHLKALARISRLFKNPQFRESILAAKSASEIYSLISLEDSRI
jgi:PTS system nitrogen regulatory IIA component